MEQEKNFSYKGLSWDEIAEHIAKFVSNLWQIHPFGEGNTRTTAVFTIKYLRSIGFDVNNDLFAKHSWYFRNALVRANYRNVRKNIEPDMSFLILFFRNLMMDEHNDLKNRYMIVNPPSEWIDEQTPTSTTAVETLIEVLAGQQLSIKEGFVSMLYPNTPKHPRQRYLLTVKGLAVYNSK